MLSSCGTEHASANSYCTMHCPRAGMQRDELSILFKLRTWSKSCFPVVLGWIANSSSASIVVTRTFSFENQQSFGLIDESKMNVHKYVLSNSTLTGVKLHKEGSQVSTPNTRQKRHIAIVLTTFGIFKFSLFSPKINSQAKSVGISWPTEVKRCRN